MGAIAIYSYNSGFIYYIPLRTGMARAIQPVSKQATQRMTRHTTLTYTESILLEGDHL